MPVEVEGKLDYSCGSSVEGNAALVVMEEESGGVEGEGVKAEKSGAVTGAASPEGCKNGG